jgi:hypothetical protein
MCHTAMLDCWSAATVAQLPGATKLLKFAHSTGPTRTATARFIVYVCYLSCKKGLHALTFICPFHTKPNSLCAVP